MTILERIEENNNVYIGKFDKQVILDLVNELTDVDGSELVNNIGSEYDNFLFASCVSDFGRVLVNNFSRNRHFDDDCFAPLGKWDIEVARGYDTTERITVIRFVDGNCSNEFVNMLILY